MALAFPSPRAQVSQKGEFTPRENQVSFGCHELCTPAPQVSSHFWRTWPHYLHFCLSIGKGIDISLSDIIFIAIPLIHTSHYNLLPGKIDVYTMFLNVSHSKSSKGERRWEDFWQIFAQVTASTMNTFARKKWVKKSIVTLKHARLGLGQQWGKGTGEEGEILISFSWAKKIPLLQKRLLSFYAALSKNRVEQI